MQTPVMLRWLSAALLLVSLSACSSISVAQAPQPMDSDTSSLTSNAAETASAYSCPVTEPVWAKPPEDSAVMDPPAFGYYYVNQDESIWASAWWFGEEEQHLRTSEEGVKMGWFRPEGAALEITGRRLDGKGPALHAHIPSGYPTRFQATGVYFLTEGCWEVSAKAGDSELMFVVRVEP